MRTTRRPWAPALCAGAILLAGCGDEPAGGGPAVERMELVPAAVTLEAIGEAVPLQARVFRGDGSVAGSVEVAWASSDGRIATVDASGLVRAVGEGEATITASYSGVAAEAVATVRQRPAGFVFEAGPADAVIGKSSGDVVVTVTDRLGSVVGSATGTVTLDAAAGSPGALSGGPRTAPLSRGRATFKDVRLDGSGSGYRLAATWEQLSATSLPFSLVVAPDVVTLLDARPGERGLLIDGFGSGRFLNDVAVRTVSDTVRVGIFQSMPGGNDEVLVFGAGRRPAMLRPAPWSAGIDTLAVATREPIRLDVTVWIVKGPFPAQSARARTALDTTTAIWAEQNAGLELGAADVVDATGDPDAPSFFELTLCNSQAGLESRIGRRAGRLNIYYVGSVDGGTDRGRACPIGGDHAVMAERSGYELLSHEVGHLLSLTHTDGMDRFDQTNVMHSASNSRHYLTEGQTFRQQFDTNSAINRIFGLRSAEARNCPASVADALCPSVTTRIWADGAFPAGSAGAPAAGIADGASGDVVERWLSVRCEMEQNEGLGERVRALGDEAVRKFEAAFRPGPARDPAGRRLSALDGLAWMGTPAALAALESIAAGESGALRAAALDRIRRAGTLR